MSARVWIIVSRNQEYVEEGFDGQKKRCEGRLRRQDRQRGREEDDTYDRQKASLNTQCPISSALLSCSRLALRAVLLESGRWVLR